VLIHLLSRNYSPGGASWGSLVPSSDVFHVRSAYVLTPLPSCFGSNSQLGPLRNVPETAEIAGSLSAAGLVLILALCLSIYGSAQFQSAPSIGVKTLSGRSVARDPLFSADG
jgi:hypothetical protein